MAGGEGNNVLIGVFPAEGRRRAAKEKIGAAPSVAEGIGTQSVKVLLVRMCLYLVGTHESMFSFTNVCLRSVCMWVFCWVSMNEVIFRLKRMSVLCCRA